MNWAIFAQLLDMGGGGGVVAIDAAVGYRAIASASLDYRADGEPLLDFRSLALRQPDYKATGAKSSDFRADGDALDYRAIERN